MTWKKIKFVKIIILYSQLILKMLIKQITRCFFNAYLHNILLLQKLIIFFFYYRKSQPVLRHLPLKPAVPASAKENKKRDLIKVRNAKFYET